MTAAKDPFSLNRGVYKDDVAKGQKTCPFCNSTNKSTAANCENCNGILAGVPVFVGPKAPDQKGKKSQRNVNINQPIGKMFVPGAPVIEPTHKAAQVIDDVDVVTNPIESTVRNFSDPDVDGTVDPEHVRQIEHSADHLGLEG